MQLASNALRVFLALLLAVPLGAGGLCCCLTDGIGQEVTAEMRAASAPSCCTKSEPAPAASGCPEEAECECPAVSDAELTPRTSVPAVAVVVHALAPPAASPEPVVAAGPAGRVAPSAHSPPGVPLYLAHSVFRS